MQEYSIPRNHLLRSLSIIFWTFIVCSCQFQPDEIYFKEVEKPDFSRIDVLINSDDSIFIYEPTTFKFIIGKENLPLKDVAVSLDSFPIPIKFFERLSDTLSFELDPENFEDGSYNLRIE